VHRGHQYIIRQMVAAAHAAGELAVALTFYPHPSVVLGRQKPPFYLNTPEEKAALLGDLGVDVVVTHPFNEQVRLIRAHEFVDLLCRHLRMSHLWIGHDFAMGYQREGNVARLGELAAEKGYTLHVIDEPIEWRGEVISSSRVRRALAEGDVVEAAGCLGRPFRLSGRVVEGAHRGKQLGIPTANLAVWEERAIPANGVYACWAWLGQDRYQSAVNVGVRPTVDATSKQTVEAHLLDFDGDLYGQTLALDFIARLRDERRFDGIEALLAQIRRDIEQAREILQRDPAEPTTSRPDSEP
jgi:riboflavin kinase/FMN adenylyltransferase